MKYVSLNSFDDLIFEIGKHKTDDADNDLRLVENAVISFFAYFKAAVKSELASLLAQDYPDRDSAYEDIKACDEACRLALEAAITNASIINKLCSAYGVDPVFLGNINDRNEVAEFCREFVEQTFLNREL